MRPLRSTYRLQLNAAQPFATVEALADYLATLGVSHAYLSPMLAARPGSDHGYDVVDPAIANPELGGEAGWRSLVDRLHDLDVGVLLDIVPNHMGTGPANPYWMDVLARGRDSEYASWFDLDWRAPERRGRVLLPVLGDRLAAIVARGELALDFPSGIPRIRYYDHLFPLSPETAAEAASWRDDPAAFAAGSEGAARMRALLARQHYELAHWRRASNDLNYRRFFDVNDLVAVRVELPEVFAATHRRLLGWAEDGAVDGFRVDHIDGLLDPLGYIERLRAELRRRLGEEEGARFPVLVEKILSPGEELRTEWAVQGTTGYEAMNDLETLFLDAAGADRVEEEYRRILRLRREKVGFRETAIRGKLLVLRGPFAADVERLARRALPLVAALHGGESTAPAAGVLREAVLQFLAGFPVYRTYVDGRSAPHPEDVRLVRLAADHAVRRGGADAAAVEAIARLLLLDVPEPLRAGALAFTQRFQQTSGPATAKGIEDTALYRYVPLVSRNEVGGEPDRELGEGGALLHEANARRAATWPDAMVATNTHDTKRSADVRARLDVLTEIPDEWAAAVARWRKLTRPFRTQVGRAALPDANTEYLIYQTLVGIWPFPDARPDDDESLTALHERVLGYVRKAAREAKAHTTWTDPDPVFETALERYVGGIFGDDGRTLRDAVEEFVRRVARPGLWNSLARVAVQQTAPGVPDLYQGDELWRFSLVDPDNRRPVDWDRRRALLEEARRVLALPPEERAERLRGMVERVEDGALKMLVTHAGLALRAAMPEPFARGDYLPLRAEGERAAHVFAFARRHGTGTVVTVAPRLTLVLGGGRPPIGEVWGTTRVALPSPPSGGRWEHVVTGELFDAGDMLEVGQVLSTVPLAILRNR